MSEYIKQLIAQGENQRLDFKFEISDSRKIARSLVAFANTDGGKLLVGVKDNGVIAGVRSDEEYHMVEAAAQLFCRPEVVFHTKEWNVGGKKVLEVIVPKDKTEKHKAPDKNDAFKVFVRVHDQNLLADPLLLEVWKRQRSAAPVRVSLAETEMWLLQFLETNESISLALFMQEAMVSKQKASLILVNFVLLGIIDMQMSEKGTKFVLKEPNYQAFFEEEKGAQSVHLYKGVKK